MRTSDTSNETTPTNSPRRVLARLATWLLVPAVLGALVFAQAKLFREATCETYDEFTYLRMGIYIFKHADFASLASPMCPPLPILLEYWLPSLRSRFVPGTEGWEKDMPAMIRQARLLTSVLVGMPLVALVYGWLARRRGWVFGAIGGGLTALSPTVIAASSIATTDACFGLFGVLTLAALNQYVVRPSRWSFGAAGAAIGLALASKQTAAILFPVALVELLIKRPGWKPGWTGVDYSLRLIFRVGVRLAGLVALAFLVDWALYGFGLARFGATGTTCTIPVIIPMAADLLPDGEAIMDVVRRSGMPLAIDTFIGQMNHAATGHGAFLMGMHSFHGWWYFFPVAIAVKSTPAELLAIALVVFLGFRRETWRDPARRLWLGSIVVLLGLGMSSSINIGQRYMLLIYPLIALLAADGLGEVAGRRRPARVIALGVALVTWQAVSIAGVAPHYLSYFNSFCGGPMEGHRYLVDSSLDWGQDLPSLRRELEARNYRKVALCYFGTAHADIYGLRSVNWTNSGPEAADCDWLALSATVMQGAYGTTSDLYHRFEGLPSARAGYSIFLYDLKDPRVRAALDKIRFPDDAPTPPERQDSSQRPASEQHRSTTKF